MNEQTKRVQFSLVYDVPVRFKYVAFNREGVLCGFMNPPIREYLTGEWADNRNEEAPYGEMIMFTTPDGKGWDTSLREVAVLKDTRQYASGIRKKKKKMAETIKRRKRLP